MAPRALRPGCFRAPRVGHRFFIRQARFAAAGALHTVYGRYDHENLSRAGAQPRLSEARHPRRCSKAPTRTATRHRQAAIAPPDRRSCSSYLAPTCSAPPRAATLINHTDTRRNRTSSPAIRVDQWSAGRPGQDRMCAATSTASGGVELPHTSGQLLPRSAGSAAFAVPMQAVIGVLQQNTNHYELCYVFCKMPPL